METERADWFWDTDEWRSYRAAHLHHEPEPHELDPVTTDSWVLDLKPELSQIKEGLSKGHRAAVAHGLWYSRVVEFSNTTWMRACHERAAGRITRPLKTWELMDSWISSDNGLCLATYGSDLVRPLSWAYFIRFEHGAYYMSACSEPDLPRSSSASHVLMWEAIKRLKSWDYGFLELGASETDGIGHFKRSFGCRFVPLGEEIAPGYAHLGERMATTTGGDALVAGGELPELAVETSR